MTRIELVHIILQEANVSKRESERIADRILKVLEKPKPEIIPETIPQHF